MGCVKGPSNNEANFFSLGTVAYNVTGWLEKNKDPLNDTVVEQFKKGTNILLSDMFSDVIGPDIGEKKAKRAKGSTFQTVSALYRVIVWRH